MREMLHEGPSIMSVQGVFSDRRLTGRDHDHDLVLYEALAKRKINQGVG